MLSSQQSSEGTKGSILLLEEYDALAAAFGSALKKFAPGRRVLRARSLGEAEQLALENRPEVLILDVDPPWAGISGFLQTLRMELPDARALVIGAGIPAQVATERGSAGALQFVSKPFELPVFGAAVQAVLGPWSQSAHARGSLRGLGTVDMVLLHCAAGGSVVLDARGDDGRAGKIYIAGGHVSHAETSHKIGPEALREIFGWSKTHFADAKATSMPARTLQTEWASIAAEILQQAKPPAPPRVSPAEESPPPAKPKKGEKIVVIDDTEMLLIFVEDVLATANPELQITTVLSGIDGVTQVAQIMPDLVLLDYSLPDINGDEVARRLLENEQTARVPILMMSGHVAEMGATAERFENIVATIEKPFLSDALVQLVGKTLAAGPKKNRRISPAKRRSEETPAQNPPPIQPTVVDAPPIEPPPSVQRRQFEIQPEPVISPPPIISSAPPVIAAPPVLERVEVVEPPIAKPIVQPALASAQMVGSIADGNQAVLGLFLEVISMQLTPQLQMGAIRAKPSSLIVSLHLASAAARGAIPPETAFQLGPAEINSDGRIHSVRVVATTQRLQPAHVRTAFEIGGVALIPDHARARVQLTPSGTTPMTIELVAQLELGSVQLSPTFQVAQLILKWPTNTVRVTLDPKATDKTGALFQPSDIRLDSAGRIAELLLKPAV